MFIFFFFFQAEDGIRDLTVTGVQTCALPISRRDPEGLGRGSARRPTARRAAPVARARGGRHAQALPDDAAAPAAPRRRAGAQIGRASCRERVEIWVVAVSLKKKTERGKA